jgi:hypothetical protein
MVHVSVPRSLFHRAVGDVTIDGVLVSSLPEGARQAATCLVGGEWFRAQVSWSAWGRAGATDGGRPIPAVGDPGDTLLAALPVVLDDEGTARGVVFGHAAGDVEVVRARFGPGHADEMRPVEGWFALAGVWSGGDVSLVAIRRGGTRVRVAVPGAGRKGASERCLSGT